MAGDAKYAAAIAIGGFSAGAIGLFTRDLNSYGLSSYDITFIRAVLTLAIITVIVAVSKDEGFGFRSKRDIISFAIFGVCKLLSDLTLFQAQITIDISLATLLQMTAPYFALVFSYFLFREKITVNKVVACLIALTGCILVTGVLTEPTSLNVIGIFFATLSGMFYSIFFIGSKVTSDKGYGPMSNLFWTILFSLVFCIPLANVGDSFSAMADIDTIPACLGLVILGTAIPYILMVWGMKKVDPSKAAMLSLTELVSATMLGILILNESVTPFKIVGILTVMASILITDVIIWNKIKKQVRMAAETVGI